MLGLGLGNYSRIEKIHTIKKKYIYSMACLMHANALPLKEHFTCLCIPDSAL